MPDEPRKVAVGSQAPDFALDGASAVVRLADCSGRVAVLLLFMRTFG